MYASVFRFPVTIILYPPTAFTSSLCHCILVASTGVLVWIICCLSFFRRVRPWSAFRTLFQQFSNNQSWAFVTITPVAGCWNITVCFYCFCINFIFLKRLIYFDFTICGRATNWEAQGLWTLNQRESRVRIPLGDGCLSEFLFVLSCEQTKNLTVVSFPSKEFYTCTKIWKRKHD
jgi:hypothetical protein